ncbi:MAG: hypothetical protein II662_01420 [Bacteroidales bacterium]|nr:hypothetical protein [Bacteroidales bacterium]
MKKILLATALFIAMGLSANAQGDGFFNDWDDVSNGIVFDDFDNGFTRGGGPNTPGHGGGDTPAPLGSGLLVLTAMGAGYMVARRRKE